MLEELTTAAVRRLDSAKAEVARLRRQEVADIALTIEEHSSMPGNYWQERWRAERLADAAKQVCVALYGAVTDE